MFLPFSVDAFRRTGLFFVNLPYRLTKVSLRIASAFRDVNLKTVAFVKVQSLRLPLKHIPAVRNLNGFGY